MGQYRPMPRGGGGATYMPCCNGQGDPNIYSLLQFNGVKQSLLFWQWQLNLFISFDIHNDMIDFRHLNS